MRDVEYPLLHVSIVLALVTILGIDGFDGYLRYLIPILAAGVLVTSWWRLISLRNSKKR